MSGSRLFGLRRILVVCGIAFGTILGLGGALYLLSWNFRQSARAIVSGLSLIELADDSERVIVSLSPLLVALHI